ncbi:MAG: ABC transporter ATP-binding protein [Thermoplasmata archaeon]
MSARPSVTAEHLTKRFGGFVALDNAEFRIEGAGAVGYLGPNGAGKTTSLKLLTRLLRPSGGRALINGLDVADDLKEALWSVGTVIETPEPYPQQTGREALRMVGEFRGLSRERTNDQIARYAELLELPPLDRRSGRLSKGQRQRVVLAGALLSEPSILLLDEPTSGLDPAERVILRRIFAERKQQGLILMSSHLLAEVAELCERVLIVNRGRILLDDSVASISARFRSHQVDVEFTLPVPAERWAAAGALVRAVTPLGGARYRIDFDGTENARAELLQACQRIGSVVGFSSSTLMLEDAYLAVLSPGAGATAGRSSGGLSAPPVPPPGTGPAG